MISLLITTKKRENPPNLVLLHFQWCGWCGPFTSEYASFKGSGERPLAMSEFSLLPSSGEMKEELVLESDGVVCLQNSSCNLIFACFSSVLLSRWAC